MLAFGAAPSKPQSRPGPHRLGPATGGKGLAMKSTGAFLFGFMAASVPISIYIAWLTYRLAEAI